MKKPLLLSVVLLGVILAPSGSVVAGGGPENVVLVVNPRSASSLCIANHYAKLRQIPPDHLFFLPWDPEVQRTDVDTFRKKILVPLIQMLVNRRLSDQIDYVIYSSDFPWGINLESDVRHFMEVMLKLQKERDESSENVPDPTKPKKKLEWPEQLTQVGSLTGLTYLWQPVAANIPTYFPLKSNHYMRLSIPEQRNARTVGFRSNRLYDENGKVVSSDGQHYLLSMMLGVTQGRGNTLAEVISYLRRSASADGTHPKGTIYFVKNDDIRSKARDQAYPIVVGELKNLGIAAEILDGTIPLNKNDVQGAVTGTPVFDWKSSGSTILPGAICENFTSFGGVMDGTEQTPLSEYLRFGAAGSCGAVTEPRAIIAKFPWPIIQLHYARGCSLAESFYQSVHGPYQLLIVGDPLCQPWADIPQVAVLGIKPDEKVKGKLTLTPTATLPKSAEVDHFELFIEGMRAAECKPGNTLPLDTTGLADGYHELRIVAVGPMPIETQGRMIIPFQTANHNRKIEASLVTKEPLQADKPIVLAANSPGSTSIIVLYGSRVVGSLTGEKGNIEIPANTLGAGPVLLRVVGLGGGGLKTNALAKPMELTVE